MVAPASPKSRLLRQSSTAARACGIVLHTITPLPAASPVALTTHPSTRVSTYANACSRSVNVRASAVGTLAARMTCLANALSHSSCAPARVGPKTTRRGRSLILVTKSCASGTSGPTTMRLISSRSHQRARRKVSVIGSGQTRPISSNPALASASTHSVLRRGLFLSFQASACSRPPVPRRRTFTESGQRSRAIGSPAL